MNFIRPGAKEIPLYINGNKISEYSIIFGVPKVSLGESHAPVNILRAVKELKKYIALITGISIPSAMDKNPIVKDCEICVGNTSRGSENYLTDEYEIKTEGNKLFINGGNRGVLYGVYSFLESCCGMRFFAENTELLLDTDEIRISDISVRYAPKIEYREVCYWNAFDTDFSVKSKINGSFMRSLPSEWGGGIGYAGGPKGLVHTFSHLVPYKRHYKKEPEVYALDGRGERNPTGLCLSNERTFQIALKTAKKWLKTSGSEDILSISVNDGNVAYCTCPDCLKVKAEEGDESGNLIRFINKIADALKKNFPDVLLDTIIYGEILEVPKITKPAPNLLIRVCGSTIRSHSYAEYGKKSILDKEPYAKEINDKIAAWGKVCNGIYVWDYPAPYVVINSVFPHFHTLHPNIKFFLENNVKGVFINGNTETTQFTALTVYLIAKLLYYSDMSDEDFQRHTDEFLCGFYGKGWRHIKAFMEYTRAQATDGHIFTSHTEPEDMFCGDYPNEERLKKMRGYFERALDEAESESERYRIGKDKLQVDYYGLYSVSDSGYEGWTEQQIDEAAQKNKELYEELKKYGITRVVENTFLPVVKDYRHSPKEWGYWDKFCTNGDRNNYNYDRDIYTLLESELPTGTIVDITFLFKTNNVNADCFGVVSGKDSYRYMTDEKGNKSSLIWDDYRHYTSVTIKDACVVNLEIFSKFEKKMSDYSGYEFVPPHKNGVMFKMENIAAGAYFFIKDVKITKK